MARRGNVKIVRGVVVLVVSSTVLEFFIMEPAELLLVDGIVSIEGVRGTINAVVVGMALDPLLIASGVVMILTVPKDAHSSNGWGWTPALALAFPMVRAPALGCCTTSFSLPPPQLWAEGEDSRFCCCVVEREC